MTKKEINKPQRRSKEDNETISDKPQNSNISPIPHSDATIPLTLYIWLSSVSNPTDSITKSGLKWTPGNEKREHCKTQIDNGTGQCRRL